MNQDRRSEQALDDCKRCPQCHHVPDVMFTAPGIWLECKQDGHKAVGDTLRKAVLNWNRYVSFVVGEEGQKLMDEVYDRTHVA